MDAPAKKRALRALGRILSFGFAQKIVLSITLVTLMASIIVATAAYGAAAQRSREAQRALGLAALNSAATEINLRFAEIRSVPVNLLSNPAVAGALTTSDHSMEYYEIHNILRPVVTSIKSYNKNVNGVTIFASSGQTYPFPFLRELSLMDYSHCLGYYEKLGVDLYATNIYWGRLDTVFERESQLSLICGASLYRDQSTLLANGMILVTVQESVILKSLSQLSGDVYVFGQGGELIVAASGVQYVQPGPVELSRVKAGESMFTAELGGVQLLVSSVAVSSTGWYIVSCVETGMLDAQSRGIFNSIIITLIITALVATALAAAISRQLTGRLLRLVETMREAAAGDLSVRCDAREGDEIGYLAGQFNSMLDHIERNTEEIKRQEKLYHRAEMKSTQAQINPHLLYNSLDSVVWKLEQGQFGDASEALTAMSEFFKLSLSKGRILVPLAQELLVCGRYIELQNKCRAKGHTLATDVPDGLLPTPIVKMTLQPIVENSILHGFDGYRDNGVISITVRAHCDGMVRIIVRDNGQGMLPLELAALRAALAQPLPGDNPQFFGLQNVNMRLRQFFGGSYSMGVNSEYMEYTETEIIIPLQSDDEKLSITD